MTTTDIIRYTTKVYEVVIMEIVYENDVAIVDGYKFRKDKKSGYYLSSKKIGTSRIRLHRYIWEKYNNALPKGYEIHHIDGNKDNNEIENLVALSKKEHLLYHGENASEELINKWKKSLEVAREKAKAWHQSEEGKAWHRQQAKISYAKRKPKKLKCKHCGKTYKTTKYGDAKFCSPTCQTAFRVKSGVDDVIRECVVCSTSFSINKYRKTKTCSKSCASKLIHINRKSS